MALARCSRPSSVDFRRRARADRQPRNHSAGPPEVLCFTVAVASAGAATIHFAVIDQHFAEYWLFGLFFVAVALAQLGWVVAIVSNPTRRVYVVGALGNALIAVTWLISRTTGLPFGPGAGEPEPVGIADAVSTAFSSHRHRRSRTAPRTRGAELEGHEDRSAADRVHRDRRSQHLPSPVSRSTGLCGDLPELLDDEPDRLHLRQQEPGTEGRGWRSRATRPVGCADEQNPPSAWEIYPAFTESSQAASDHAAVFVDVNM